MIIEQVSLLEIYTYKRHVVQIFNTDFCVGHEAECFTNLVEAFQLERKSCFIGSREANQKNTWLDGEKFCYFGRTEQFVNIFL